MKNSLEDVDDLFLHCLVVFLFGKNYRGILEYKGYYRISPIFIYGNLLHEWEKHQGFKGKGVMEL